MKKRVFVRRPKTADGESTEAAPAESEGDKPKKNFQLRSMGYAFATCASSQDAEAVINQLNGTEVNGRVLKVEMATPPVKKDKEPVAAEQAAHDQQVPKQTKSKPKAARKPKKPALDLPTENLVHVSNLAFSTTESSLSEFIKTQAPSVSIHSARIVRYPVSKKYLAEQTEQGTPKEQILGRSKGYGFVQLASTAEVDKVVQDVNGKELDGRELRVKVSVPRPAAASATEEENGHASASADEEKTKTKPKKKPAKKSSEAEQQA